MDKKKIFWIAHEGSRSGANNALLDYSESLKNEGYAVLVVVPSAGNMIEEAESRGLKTKLFYYYNMVYSGRFDIFFWIRKRSRNFITFLQVIFFTRRNRPDYIITNSIVNTPLFSIVASIFGIKHIWFIQEFGNADHGLKFDFGYSVSARLINLFSKRIAVVSDAVRQHLKSFISFNKMTVIFNRIFIPANIERRKPVAQHKPFKILHLAHLGPGKNQLEALKAFKILADDKLNVVLELAGANTNADYLNLLTLFLKNNKLEDRVDISGFTTEAYKKIINADLVILCSRFEACALTIFETMQLGTPLIVSDTGGNTEIIENNNSGLVYSAGSPQDLADKIKMLYLDFDFAEKLASKAHQISKTEYITDISVKQIKLML